ncbi:MAG: L-serine ammonia-lyase, iron-sulfur-dependent subunit beta [Tissierellia bacterium]|nr:L-serine ammonia-lyase, iron-sulfur-dependent subunit beta [Tissierellia bacterium]
MNKISYFNVVGPVMIGPSSSHTAGAVRIGGAARSIVEDGFYKIVFKLYGSFASTYMGHGTDKALVAGALGFKPDDERIKRSFEIAEEMGIELDFKAVNLVNAHPNTAIIEFHYRDGKTSCIQGISTGGAQIEIVKIDGQDVRIFPGDPTLVIQYVDRPGIISTVSTILAKNNYNIEKIMNNRGQDQVTLVIILDRKLDEKVYEEIKNSDEYDHTSYVYF